MTEHFMQYKDTLNQIQEIQSKLIYIKNKMYSIKGISYDTTPKGTAGNIDTLYFLAEIEELEAELQELKQKRNHLKEVHEQEIAKVKVPKYMSVLRMYYLLGFDAWRIADTLEISESYVFRLKKDAIQAFKKVNNIK